MNFTFCLSEISTRKSRTKRRSGLQETVHKVDADSPLINDYGLVDGPRLCMSQPTLGTVQAFDTGPEEYRASSQPVYLSDEDLHDGSYGLERGTDSFSSVLSNSGEANDPTPRSAWVRNTTRKRRADDEPLDAGLGLHELVQLTHVALRTLICDYKKRATAGIKCVSKSVGPRLSDIAPALFSPGYHNVSPKSALVSSSTSLMLKDVGRLATQSFPSSDSSCFFVHAATYHFHYT